VLSLVCVVIIILVIDVIEFFASLVALDELFCSRENRFSLLYFLEFSAI